MSLTHVESPITGTVWKIVTAVGDTVSEGDELMVLESMKMEIPVEAPSSGTITAFLVNEGDPIEEGQAVAELDESHRRG